MKLKAILLIAVFNSLLMLSNVCCAAQVAQTMQPAISLPTTSVPTNALTPMVNRVGYIFIGDSRLKGVDCFGGLSASDDIWVLSDVSRGYSYLTSNAAADILAIESANPHISTWYEVYALGLNDIGNKDKYCLWYLNRSMAHNLMVVSVNPVEYHKCITNDMVASFNASLAMTGLKYIDSRNFLLTNGYSTSDGTHYKNDTNRLLAVYLASAVRGMGR